MTTIGERLAGASNRFYGRLRHPGAFQVAAQAGERRSLSPLVGHKYALLNTFRRSGEPVPTPVWFGMAEGRVYVRSEAAVGKVKRVRNQSRVTVAPCSVRGKPLGPLMEGRARILSGEEEALAEAALEANYGLGRRMYEGVAERTGLETVYIEISPVEEDEA